MNKDLKDFGLELEGVKGLLEETVEEADQPPVKVDQPEEPAEKDEPKEEELIRVTIRVTPDMEDRLFKYQRMQRKKGVSKRDSSFNAIIVSAIEAYLKKRKV